MLTMRASTLRNYAGQAALPGGTSLIYTLPFLHARREHYGYLDALAANNSIGKADTLNESPFEVARREAYEEIGLPITDTKLPPGFKVEHLCELPANLAKTELGVRPCVAFLCPSTGSSTSSNAKDSEGAGAVEEKMIPRLDPKEVAAVFTAPFRNFLKKNWESGSPGPLNKNGAKHSWYRGSWTDWHESRWRMHNFYIPRPPSSPTQIRSKSSPNSPSPGGRTPEGDDPTPEPMPLDDLTTFRVFGMTARILVDAARVAYGEEPEFEHNSHFGDEEMIGRLLKIGRLSEIRKKGEELTREVLREASKI